MGIESGKSYKITRRFRKNAIKISVRRITKWGGMGEVIWAYRISPSGYTYGYGEIPYLLSEIESVEEIT